MPIVFYISENWTFQIVSVMLKNWSIHSKPFLPFSEASFFVSKHVTVWAILSVKKVKSKHIRNERNTEIIWCPPPTQDTLYHIISVS